MKWTDNPQAMKFGYLWLLILILMFLYSDNFCAIVDGIAHSEFYWTVFDRVYDIYLNAHIICWIDNCIIL